MTEETKGRNSAGRGEQGSLKASGQKHRKGKLKVRVAELEEALERTAAESAENYDRLLRARAEYENLKKRTGRDIELAHRRAGERLVVGLLPAIDDLEKAIEASKKTEELKSMEQGLSLILKRLLETLKDSGVSPIDPLGERFDPNLHEAIMQAPADGVGRDTVIEVLQKGYLMNGVTLRVAKVVVSGGPNAAAPEVESGPDARGGTRDEEV